MSRGSKRSMDFEIFSFSAEPESPKPATSNRPRRTISVREPPNMRGKLTTAERLQRLCLANSNRITNTNERQKLERQKALACRQILARRKEDPNLVLDLTRDAPLGHQTNIQTQPDELVSEDDEDEQDFAQPHTVRTLFSSPERDTAPRPSNKPSPKRRRGSEHIAECLDDENVPRSRLKKRRVNGPSKRVSIPASSSVFAPNVQDAMRPSKAYRNHRPKAMSIPRKPFKPLNTHNRAPHFSSTASTKWHHERHPLRSSPDKPGRYQVDSTKTKISQAFNLKPSTTTSRAKDLQEVYEISDDDDDFVGSAGQPREKNRKHQKTSVFHKDTSHTLKRPRPARNEDRKIPTSTFYGCKGRKEHGHGGVSPLKGRLDTSPSEGIVRLKIEDHGNSGSKQLHKGKLERRHQRHSKGKIQYESSEEDDESTTEQIDIRFKPLSSPELEVVRSLTFKISKNKVMAKIPEANIELKAGDFSCLRGSRWLNDEIMNSFVALINARNETHVVKHSKTGLSKTNSQVEEDDEITEVAVTSSKPMEVFRRPRPRMHLFNTFFFTRLSQHGYDYSGVRRWLKRAEKKVTDLDLIMSPINLSNFHWVLAAIDLRGKQFLYLDSTFGKDSYGTIPLLRRWLHDEVVDKDGASAAAEMQIDTWGTIVNPAYLPEQRDDGSCGIFTLYMAEYLERGKKPDFKQENIRTLRQRTALFLKRGKLPYT